MARRRSTTKRRSKPKRRWIQRALRKHKKGSLHRQLGVPAGRKIPLSILRRAARQFGILGRRARLALTLRKMKHKTRRSRNRSR